MTKRSRKNAFGKANVVRRPSLKTIPVLAIDPLSHDRSAPRKNVRTTLLLGTALGTGLIAATTVMVMSTSTAMAACFTHGWCETAHYNLDFSGAGPFTSGNDPIAFGPAGGSQGRAFWDLTIVTNGTVAVGNNGFGHGIGINAPFASFIVRSIWRLHVECNDQQRHHDPRRQRRR